MQRLRAYLFLTIVGRGLLLCIFLFVGVMDLDQTAQLPDAPSTHQGQSTTGIVQHDRRHEPSKNHILWIIPNYRSDENPGEIKALTPAEKMKVSLDDSFDPSAFLVAGIFAGMSMAEKQYGSFGTGAQGFGKYYGGAFADQAIGNIMT